MIWVDIGSIMVGQWKVYDGIKMTADAYIAFLNLGLKIKESTSEEPSYLYKIMLPHI